MKKIYLSGTFIKSLFIFCSFLLFAFWANGQKTWNGAPGASWNVAANWTPAGIPLAADAVIIPAGRTPVITAAATCLSLQINNSPNDLIITSLTINTGQTLTVGSGTGSVTIGSATAMANKASSTTSLIVNGSLLSGNINQRPGNLTTGSGGDGKTDLTINVDGTVTVVGNVTGLSLNGKAALSATASVIFTGTGTLNVTGIFTTTVFTPSTGLVNYNGTSAQTTAYPAYGSLKINNAVGVTTGVAATVTNLFIGDVTLSSILNDNGNQITGSGAFTFVSGTFNIGTGSTATTWPGFSSINTNISTGATVNYNSSLAQTIAAVNYFNLSNTANGPRTLPGSGIVGVAGTLLPGTGNYTVNSGSTVSFNGTAAQTIPAINPSLTFAFNTLVINNNLGISSIANNITVSNSLVLTKGIVTTGAQKIIIAGNGFVSRTATGGWVNGNLQKDVNLGSTSPFNYEIGDATYYCPVTVNYAVVSAAGSLVATVTTSPIAHPALSSSGLDNTKSVTRFWTLAKVGALAGTYDATFNYNSQSVPVAANTNNFVVRNYSGSTWVTPVAATGSKTPTSTQATGLTSYGDFSIGESTGIPTVAASPAPSSSVCEGGGTSFTSSSASTPTPLIEWQRSNDNGVTWDDITASTDGSNKYTNFTTATLSIANTVISMNGYLYRAKFTNINGISYSNVAGGKLIVSVLPIITTMAYPSTTFSTASPAQSGPAFTGSNYIGGTFSYISTPAGLSLANFNTTTGAFTPVGSAVGSYTISYSVTNGACTPVTKSATINISSAAISYAQSTYCSSDAGLRSLIFSGFTENTSAPITVSVLSGGPSLNNNRGDFTPSIANPGTYMITYTDGPVVLSTTVTVTQLPAATISYLNSNICNLDGSPYPVSFTGTTGAFSGGVFSYTPTVAGRILNIVANGGTVANPLGSITGTGSDGDVYNVVYTIPASGGCPAVATSPTVVTITAIPAATLTYGTGGYAICAAAGSVSPVVTGLPGGGIFTQPSGQTGLTVSAAGVIDAGTSTPGFYNMIYTVNSGTTCGDVSITSAAIEIVDNPSLSINYSASNYCTSEAGVKTVTFTGTGSYAGATFSAPANLSIAAASGSITPSASIAAVGNPYLVTAIIPNCPLATPITTFVEINPSPSATISYPAVAFCESDGTQYDVLINGTTGGTFTYTSVPATGVSLNINQPSGGDITPSGSNPGVYTILYNIAIGACSTSASAVVTITPVVGTTTLSLAGSSTEPTCQITASTPTTTYTASAANNTGFTWSISPAGAGSISSTGVVTWTVGFSGSPVIGVQAQGCGASTTSASRNLTITPSVTTPLFASGATSIRCQGAGTNTYDAAATNTTGITYSLDGASITGGNLIVAATGEVTFAAGWSGTTVITASAAGCNGPLSATHTVTITATVGTPVFTLGTTSTRCQGAGTVTYAATASVNTGITYTLDAISEAAGNTINAGTGEVTYVVGWSGTSVITASAAGCNGPKASSHTVTITPTVTIALFSPATSTRCQGAGIITTTTTATNSTGITYGLDAASITGGNSIVATTGAVTYAATWSGATTITASAVGCNGPATTAHVVTINPPAAGGTVTPALKTECFNLNGSTITLSGNTGVVIRWEQSVDFGSTWTTALVTTSTTYSYTNLTQTTFFRAIVQSGVCVTTANSTMAQVIVNPAFVSTITASSLTTCVGVPVDLTASGYTSSGQAFIGGNMESNGPNGGWTGSTGSASNNNGSNFQWGRTNGATYNGIPYSSATGDFFITGGTYSGALATPSFNTVGMSSAWLVFNQAYNLVPGTGATVEISVDGGATYVVLESYTGNSTPSVSFSATKTVINLNSYLGRTNLKIRFNYAGKALSNWAIDNVHVTNDYINNPSGTNIYNPLTYTWSSSATPSGLSSTSGNTTTFTPTTAGTVKIDLSTIITGCTTSSPSLPVNITVNPLPTATISGTTQVCLNAPQPLITFTGFNGTAPYTFTYKIGSGANLTVTTTVGSSVTTIAAPTALAGSFVYTLMSVRDASSSACIQSQTGEAIITVNPLPTAIISGTAAICLNAPEPLVTFTGAGGTTPYTFTYKIGSGANQTIATVLGNSVTLAAPTNAAGSFVYTLISVQDGPSTACTQLQTGTATVTVSASTVPGTLTSVSECTSGTSGSLTLMGNTGGVIQWESSLDNFATAGTPITNVTTSQAYTALAQTRFYRALVQSGTCSQQYSTVATVGLHNIWTGVTSTDWNTGSNWSDGLVASNTCPIVTIQTGNPHAAILSTGPAATIKSLVIAPGASLTLTNNSIAIEGSITNNGGIFDVKKGSLVFNGVTTQSISGNMFYGDTLRNLTVSNVNGLNITGANIPLYITGEVGFGNVNNTTISTGDNLVLVSDANGTARVADLTNNDINSGDTIVGKVVVERFYGASRSWRLVTAPLSNTGNIFNSWQGGAPATYVPGKGMFVTGPNPDIAANGLDYSYFNNSSMKSWNPTTGSYMNIVDTRSQLLSNTSTPGIAANIGYYTFVRGDRRRVPDNTVFGNSNNTVLSSKGNLQTGRQKFSFSGIAGGPTPTVFLIGNPYASSVDFNSLDKSDNVFANRFFVFDPSLGTVGLFVVMEKDGSGNYMPTDRPTSLQRNHIQSSQAFFIQLQASGNGSLTFNEKDKSTDYTPGLFRPAKPLDERQGLRIELYHANADQSTLLVDGTLAQFDEQYADKVDIQDAFKFANITENLSLLRHKQYLAVERRPLITDNDTLFLHLSKTTQRNYRFVIEPTNIEPTLAAFLEDSYTMLSTPINLLAASNFDFAITSDARSSAVNRFRIVFKQAALGPLPVTFKTIKANQQQAKIAVNWTVENELNIKQYEVEKSADGVSFSTVNTTTATGANRITTNYNWLDANPLSGNNYYRVRSVGLDGTFDYSSTVLVKMGKMASGIRIYPNPVTDIIGAEFKNMSAGIYTARLLNALGQTVFVKLVNHAAGTSLETIKPDYKLLSGIYQLELTAPDKAITMVKVIVK